MPTSSATSWAPPCPHRRRVLLPGFWLIDHRFRLIKGPWPTLGVDRHKGKNPPGDTVHLIGYARPPPGFHVYLHGGSAGGKQRAIYAHLIADFHRAQKGHGVDGDGHASSMRNARRQI